MEQEPNQIHELLGQLYFLHEQISNLQDAIRGLKRNESVLNSRARNFAYELMAEMNIDYRSPEAKETIESLIYNNEDEEQLYKIKFNPQICFFEFIPVEIINSNDELEYSKYQPSHREN